MRNRFKGPDLIDRVPDELWTEVCDILQETGIKIISMEKKCKKAKWQSGEALQIAVKRREAKRDRINRCNSSVKILGSKTNTTLFCLQKVKGKVKSVSQV